MSLFKRVISCCFILILMQSIGIAQDSLYLIGTIQGVNVDEPIYNINKAGDLNGDGYDDFITTIPQANYCNVYFGGENIDFNPDIVLYNPPDIYDFGFFLGDVGDVNKDGFDDIVIQGKYDPLFFIGQVFLYYGGNQFDTIPAFTFRDNFIQDALGASISGGDVNGDGYSDFIIGNPYNWSNGTGRAYLFLGNETIADTPAVTFISDSLEDFFGDCVSMDGDLNGDGFNDIIISAANILGLENIRSEVFLYLGRSIVLNDPDKIIQFDISYSSINTIYASNFNSDLFDDFYVTNENKLLFGSSDLLADNYLKFSSTEEMDSFGNTAGNAGDINGDGYRDLIIGATNHRNLEDVMVGGAYIYLGSDNPDAISDYFIEGETKWSNYGSKVGSCGDLNGDGFDEMYVLANGYPNHENPLGKVYIYSMKKFVVSLEDDLDEIPNDFKLFQNYPNPYNPVTKIDFNILHEAHVTLTVYNILGKEIIQLVNNKLAKGFHSINLNANELPSGIYFYNLQAGEFTETKKMVLLR